MDKSNEPCVLEVWQWSNVGQRMFCSGCGEWADQHRKRTTRFNWIEAIG